MKQHICNCVISCSCFKNRKAAFAYLNLCSRSLELLSPGWNLKVLRECTFEDNAWGWGAPLLVWNLSANHSRWCWFWWPLRIFPQCLWQIYGLSCRHHNFLTSDFAERSWKTDFGGYDRLCLGALSGAAWDVINWQLLGGTDVKPRGIGRRVGIIPGWSCQ